MPETLITTPIYRGAYLRRLESSLMWLWECWILHISSCLSVGLIAFWFLRYLYSEKIGLLKSKHRRAVCLADSVNIVFGKLCVCV